MWVPNKTYSKIFREVYEEFKDHPDFHGNIDTPQDIFHSHFRSMSKAINTLKAPIVSFPRLFTMIPVYKRWRAHLGKVQSGQRLSRLKNKNFLNVYIMLYLACKRVSFAERVRRGRFGNRMHKIIPNHEKFTISKKDYVEPVLQEWPQIFKERGIDLESARNEINSDLISCLPLSFTEANN